MASETSRVVKQTGTYVRPDKGERVSVKLTLRVDEVSLDGVLDRVRIRGVIVDAPEDFPLKHAHHSLVAAPGKNLGIRKRNWTDLQTRLLRGSALGEDMFMVVAIDSREAGISLVKGTRVENVASVESGVSGKMYSSREQGYGRFFEKIRGILEVHLLPGIKVVVSGPGNLKNVFANYLRNELGGKALMVDLIEGTDLAGEDGVRQVLRSDGFKEVMKSSKMVRASLVLDEALRRVSRSDPRVAMGFSEVLEAARNGAVETMLAADKVFEGKVTDEEIVQLFNQVEENRGRVFLLDGSTDLGLQVSTLSGLLALLRFQVAH